MFGTLVLFRLGIKELTNRIRSDKHGLHGDADVRQVFDRTEHLQHGNDKRHKFADGGIALLTLPKGDKDDDSQSKRRNQFAERRTRRTGLCDFFTETDNGVIDFGKAFGRFLLTAEELDHAVSLVDFVNDVIERTDTLLRTGNDIFQTVAVIAGQ